MRISRPARLVGTVLSSLAILGSALSPSNAQTTPVPGIPGPAGEQEGPAVAAGAGGAVFVGDKTGTIRQLSESGAVTRTVASLPHGVTGLALDSSGAIFATSHWFDYDKRLWQASVSRIESSGALTWSSSTVVGGTVAVTGDTVWVGGYRSDTGAANVVYGLDAEDGSATTSYPVGEQPVRDLAALPNGNLIVATDYNAHEYRVDGQQVRQLNDFGALVAVGPNGDLYGAAGRAPGGVAGPHSFQLHRTDAQGQLLSDYAPASSFVSDLAVSSTGIVWAVGYQNMPLARIDATTPDAMLKAAESVINTGAPVQLDASGSSAVFNKIVGYEWDLDGNGSFETPSGTSPTVSASFATPGVRRPAVRVTAVGGGSSVASVEVDVRKASPVGPLGVSINGGAQFTNDPIVTVTARWPRFATRAWLSNDGGFGTFGDLALNDQMAWTLESSGPERLPKTIYVRFVGGTSGAETYQDDIILDETNPKVLRVSASVGKSARQRPAVWAKPGGKRVVALKLKAEDKTSGVDTMQITTKKGRPGRWVDYKRKAKVRIAGSKVFVRVQDRAGNPSRWMRVKIQIR